MGGGGAVVWCAAAATAAVFKNDKRRRIKNEVEQLMSSFSEEIETPLFPPVTKETNTQCRERGKTLHFIYQKLAPTNPLRSANKKKISIHLSIYPCVDKSKPNNLDPCAVDG